MIISYEVPGLISFANEETQNENHEISFLKEVAASGF